MEGTSDPPHYKSKRKTINFKIVKTHDLATTAMFLKVGKTAVDLRTYWYKLRLPGAMVVSVNDNQYMPLKQYLMNCMALLTRHYSLNYPFNIEILYVIHRIHLIHTYAYTHIHTYTYT